MSKVIIRMSAEELDKFLSGTTGASLELKHNVIKTFGRKYLAGYLEDVFSEEVNAEVGKMKSVVKSEVRRQVDAAFVESTKPRSYGSPSTVTLHHGIRDAIESHTQSIVKETINSSVEKGVDGILKYKLNRIHQEMEAVLISKLNEQLGKRLVSKIKTLIDEEFAQHSTNNDH